MKKILSLAGIYLLCRLVYFSLGQLLPFYFPSHIFLPKAVFFLLALFLVNELVMKIPLSPARLFCFALLACTADELGETARHFDMEPIAVLLMVWLPLTLLLYRRAISLSRAKFVCTFLSPGALAILLILITGFSFYFDYFAIGCTEMTEFPTDSLLASLETFDFPTNNLLPHLELLTVASRPDLLLPQFAFFSWTAWCIERGQSKVQ